MCIHNSRLVWEVGRERPVNLLNAQFELKIIKLDVLRHSAAVGKYNHLMSFYLYNIINQ